MLTGYNFVQEVSGLMLVIIERRQLFQPVIINIYKENKTRSRISSSWPHISI